MILLLNTTIRMIPIGVKSSTYIDFNVENKWERF